MRRGVVRWMMPMVHAAALAPLVVLAWMFWQDSLGPAPVAAVIRRLGRYALVLLLLSLVPTVVKTVSGLGQLLRMRRALGLYAFLYASLHFLAFAGLDYRFDLGLIGTTLAESRREIVGLGALLILGVLALTSIPGLVRQLGKAWKPLHRLVYGAAVLVVLHYVWNYKELRAWPLLAGATVLLLLIARVPPVVSSLSERRSQGKQASTQ